MSGKPLVRRALARQDIEQTIDYYDAVGQQVALGFIDALEGALRAIAEHPASGSPRYAHELGLPGLRCRPLKSFPHLVFYIEREEHVDVWRVLHAERDIPAHLSGPEF